MNRRSTTAFAGASALLDRGVRDQLRLAWRLMRDDRVSTLKFALPVLIGLYVLSPIDTIPDFFLGLGQIDDLGLVTVVVLILARLIPRLAPGHVVDEHLRDMGMGYPVWATPWRSMGETCTIPSRPGSTFGVSREVRELD